MPHRRLRLAAGLLTFVVGTSLASYLRDYGLIPDCFCTRAKCRIAFVVEHPATAFLHPLETEGLSWTARRAD